jgi:hypothetical protein
LTLKATIDGVRVEKEIDITRRVNPGQTVELKGLSQPDAYPELSIDFQAYEIPKFDQDITFPLTAEVSSASTATRPGADTKEVKIPLPIVFVHGYAGPPDRKHVFSRIFGFTDLFFFEEQAQKLLR